MTIDTNELRQKLSSVDIVDHIDIHANVKSILTELLDRLDTAEKERDFAKTEIARLHDDIIERLRIESRREPHEPIWRDAIDEIEALRAEVDALRLNDASVQPELVAVALAACDAVDDLIEKWYATRESGCLPNQVVRARGASKLLRAIALEGTK